MIPDVPDHIRKCGEVTYEGKRRRVVDWHFGYPSGVAGQIGWVPNLTVVWVLLDGDETVEGTMNIHPVVGDPPQ